MNELQIRSSSRGMLLEAVRTFPVQPKYAKIVFTADGLPKYVDAKEEGSWLAECAKRKIIPDSRVKLEYNNDAGTFVAEKYGEGILINYMDSSTERREVAVSQLISGGRIYRIEAELGIRAQSGFQTFTGEFLDKMLGASYQIYEGELWISKRHSNQHYIEGDYPLSRLFLGTYGLTAGIDLRLDDKLASGPREKLSDWFSQLEKKYSSVPAASEETGAACPVAGAK